MYRNVAGQSIGAQLVDSNGAFTGAVTVYVTGDAGTQAIGSVASGICTHEGNGYHTYRPSQAETNYALIAFTFVGTGAAIQTVQVETEDSNPAARAADFFGDDNYSITAGDIIVDALRMIQALDEDESASPAATEFALRRLNNILAFMSTKGFNMWRRQEVVLPLVTGQAMYLLGNLTTDAEWADEEDFFATTTTVAAIATATTITVSSATNIANGDRIGIELDDGTRQWTTVNGAPSGSVVTLTAALTGAAASGATIYTYTTRPNRPLRVIHGRRRSSATANDISVAIEAQETYQSQPSKSGSGTVTMLAYKPTLTSGRLTIWQPSNNVRQMLRMTVEKQFAAISTTDTIPDVPAEWYESVTTMLADACEPSYGQLDALRVKKLQADSREMKLAVEMFDSDPGSVTFVASRRR